MRLWRRSCAYANDVSDLVSLVLLLLAVARLTRLVVTDQIGLPIRQWVLVRSGDQGWWTYAIHCPWCVGMWFSLVASPLWYYFRHNPVFLMLCVALALSQAVGLLFKVDKEN